MDVTDHHLLDRIAAGDDAAFADFYDRHAPRVLGSLLRLLGQRDDAEDVLQETFWQVWSRAGQYDPGRSTPGVWLFLIARSRALDRLRQQRPRGEGTPQEPVTLAEPLESMERKETSQQVRAALAQLPDEQCRAITLAFFGGLTYEQVAQRLAVPVGTAKTRIRLGMRRLRHLLGD
jgi:RNA polymerase sigma-70 factor (ECF subfamily)